MSRYITSIFEDVHIILLYAVTPLPEFTETDLDTATHGFTSEIGRGGFGVVFKGMLNSTPVAIKALSQVSINLKSYIHVTTAKFISMICVGWH